MALPFVSCVCITGKTKRHVKEFLSVAMQCYVDQAYPQERREMVVVYDTPRLVADLGPDIRTLRYRAGGTLGDMRNFGLLWSAGDVVIQWDDDDYSHRCRLQEQVDAYLAGPGKPVFLARQLCYSWVSDTAFVRELPGLPIFGTILHPNPTRQRYPPLQATEDLVFAHQWPEWTIMDNDPCLYTRMYFGSANTTSENDVMRGRQGEVGQWDLTPGQAKYLREVLAKYPCNRLQERR